ncbi:MAG: hypothetical protein R3B54_00210 [Bdellovibrionota bacterium]
MKTRWQPNPGAGFAQAAGIPLTISTAWRAVFNFAALKKGETVLITRVPAGSGSMAVSLPSKLEQRSSPRRVQRTTLT